MLKFEITWRIVKHCQLVMSLDCADANSEVAEIHPDVDFRTAASSTYIWTGHNGVGEDCNQSRAANSVCDNVGELIGLR